MSSMDERTEEAIEEVGHIMEGLQEIQRAAAVEALRLKIEEQARAKREAEGR